MNTNERKMQTNTDEKNGTESTNHIMNYLIERLFAKLRNSILLERGPIRIFNNIPCSKPPAPLQYEQ